MFARRMQRELPSMNRRMMALAVLLMSSLPFAPNGRGQTKNQKGQASLYQDSEGYEAISVLLNAVSVVRKNDTIRIDPRTAPGKYVAAMKARCSRTPAEFQSTS